MTYQELSALHKMNKYKFLQGCCGGLNIVCEVYAHDIDTAKQVALLNSVKYDFVTETKLYH